MPETLPWYGPAAATLLAAGVAAAVAVLTVRWNRVQQLADRRTDRAERRAREARLRMEVELREQRVANRTAWTTHYQRIDDLLMSTAKVAYEAQRWRLHEGDPETTELIRLSKAAEQYAEFAPGGLPAALNEVAQAMRGVLRHLLPAEATLRSIGAPDARASGYQPLFTKAGEQTRAADRLTAALATARGALHHEWGSDS